MLFGIALPASNIRIVGRYMEMRYAKKTHQMFTDKDAFKYGVDAMHRLTGAYHGCVAIRVHGRVVPAHCLYITTNWDEKSIRKAHDSYKINVFLKKLFLYGKAYPQWYETYTLRHTMLGRTNH